MNTFFRGASSAVDGPKNSVENTDSAAQEMFNESIKTDSAEESGENHWFPIDRLNRVMIGAYPRNLEEIETLILNYRVRCIVNLTSDKTFESWLPFMNAAAAKERVEVLYRPMLRRDEISDDGKVINLCREISRWLEANPKESCIYVHSELGYGRAGIVAAILAGDFECLQTNHAIAFVEHRRNTFRSADQQRERCVPTIETSAQMDQVFRVLGNPQQTVGENEDQEGIRFINKAKPKEDEEEAKVDDEQELGGFEPLESEKKTSAKELTTKRGIMHSKETEYVPLPDRSEQSWRIEADKWIKERKAARKKQIFKLNENIGQKK